MRITILFGGTNKERLVSVASAQALHRALPEADLWFWHVADTVHEAFANFALTGEPGWPAFDDQNEAVMIFDTESRVERGVHFES